MDKTAYANSTYRALARLARPYYPADGPNSWAHIQEVRRRARRMTRELYGRELTPVEYAAVLFHDNTKREFGGKNHGPMGADRAATLLAASALLKARDIDRTAQAIRVHDDNLKRFPSRTAELLASADANPPDVDWFLNKAWAWNKNHNYNDEESWQDLEDTVAENYGTHGKFNYPAIYRRYYGERVPSYRKTLDALQGDRPEIQRRLREYWAKYNIDPEHPHVVHNV